MKRWNGWGDETVEYPLPGSAAKYLNSIVGSGAHIEDCTLDQALKTIPKSRLPASHYFTTEPEDRLRHARGQSLPDWIALHSNRIGCYPDGVAYPTRTEEVQEILSFAQKNRVRVIPYGGGSSVVGHINPLTGEPPVLTVDLSRLNRVLEVDPTSQTAVCEAGILGPELESQLNQQGFTFGHFPQSFEYSSLGGWIATRSCGQQSYHYGRIEDHFLGGHLETFSGHLDLPVFPASAAGPDLKHLVLGSEGRMGILTQATVRVFALPESETFRAIFFPDWESGVSAVREISQSDVRVSMLRLSDPIETETTLVLSGKDILVGWARRGLGWIGIGKERCLLVYGVTGSRPKAARAAHQVVSISTRHHGFPVDFFIGNMWRKSRFLTPYLRNTLWEYGYALDTLETAMPWKNVGSAACTIRDALREGLANQGEQVLAFVHLSHIYQTGASFYVTYLFRRCKDPEACLERWWTLKDLASRLILEMGGTISHQHGVGQDHAQYLPSEKGTLGIRLIQSAFDVFDPDGLLNPGKLVCSPSREVHHELIGQSPGILG